MADPSRQLLARGQKALERADWAAAREAFEDAIAKGAGVAARLGLADALWWLGDADALLEQLEAAYREARCAGRVADVAWSALYIAVCQETLFGNQPAAAGWCARGRRLIEEHGLEGLRSYGALFESMILEDAPEAARHAREAMELGRRAGDADVELCALAQLGEIHIRRGRIREGIELLDEAMAGAIGGEGAHLATLVFASCCMIRGCQDCAEFERARQWLHNSDRFCQRYDCPFLFVGCRTTYGALLFFSGNWPMAERELRLAMLECGQVAPVYFGEVLATLADLRLAQGRERDAQRLLADRQEDPPTAVVRARLQLMRGDLDRAAHIARHWRGALAGKPLVSARLQEVLGETALLRGDHEAAASIGRALVEQGAAGGAVLSAYGRRLIGYAEEDTVASREALESALTSFRQLGMPYEAARSSFGLAQALCETEPRMALLEARTAEASFRALGAQRDADLATALRRRLGDAGCTPGPRVVGELTKREQQVMALLGDGLSNPAIAEHLCISRRTVEHHVSSILDKRGLTNRAEIAAEAVRRDMEASATKNR
ncbi:regulatory protein, luxR family [Franzmannia pantelleriensis]|uniref:Regulatory protein, luxR family n=1 Tax=Franzmannia pantelleriensis TaxID=48727 RepID=A0A1G9URQ6_9GAMM|nr:LuxR C-terminal-related transcriptional regulator [Halomonas pantelleriensis]SDM62599.1 regulatory protein, luxR family [Halomonas pantelleriensis]